VVIFIPMLLYPGVRAPWYSLNRRLGRFQSHCEHYGEKENFLLLPGVEYWSSRM
jgi:hypothetical protein